MSNDDDDKPKRRRGRPPKLRVIEGSTDRPAALPDVDARLRYDHKVAQYCRYRIYGYSTANAELASGYDGGNPELVRRHMALIKQGISKALNVTADNLILEIEEVRASAMIDQQYNVALAAIALKGKIKNLLDAGAGGFEPDKIPKPASEPVDVTEMSVEEWKARFAPNRQS